MVINIEVSKQEYNAIKSCAEKNNMKINDFIVKTVINKVKKEG